MKNAYALLSMGICAGASFAVPDYFASLEVERAWEITQGDASIKVALIGTGVNYELPEIASVIQKNSGEYGDGKETDGIDNDGNGYVDDVIGINTYSETSDPNDVLGVTTHSASVIASQTYGIAKGVSIIPIAVTNNYGGSTYEALQKALTYAANRKADLIHLSMGGAPRKEQLEQFCALVRSIEIPIIAVAGNEGVNLNEQTNRSLFLPADCDAENLIVVAALNQEGNMTHFSNYGDSAVDLAAPGTVIPGFNRLGEEGALTGTTIASAVVAGVAALVKSLRPEITAAELKSVLVESSDPNSSLLGKVLSGGRVNAFKAVSQASN